jgi:predicted permease
MDSLFFQSFYSIFQALLKIFLIAGLAGLLAYRKVITEELLDGLSMLVVYVFLPLMTFSTIINTFEPSKHSYWWWVPIVSVVLPIAGLLFSSLLFAGNITQKKILLPLTSMQNAAYLILPIGEFAFRDQFEEFSLICFLVLLGLNPFMWSVGKVILTGNKGNGSFISNILTPPFIANILAIALVLTRTERYVPDFITESARFLGSATVPVATFILGATLALSIRSIPSFRDTLRVILVKFVFLPAVMIAFLFISGAGKQFPLLAQVLILQASSAPATAHILMVRTYGGDSRTVGGIIFVSYFVCILAIPFWLTLWGMLQGT